MGKYDDLMEHLNPRVIIEKTEVPHDNARAGCTIQSSVVGSYSEFEDLVIAYVVHHMQQTAGLAPPPELCLDKARNFLEHSMGFNNAVFTGLSGTDGGMLNVLNQLNEGFKNEAKKAYFNYFLDRFIDPLSFPEIVELMREFKGRIGAYSPESFGYISPEQMAGNYREIFWQYIDTLTKYRNLWSY